MYQYKARIKSTREIIAEGHSVDDIEHQIKRFRREQKHGEHTMGHEPIEILHIKRNQKQGARKSSEELVRVDVVRKLNTSKK